jgi:HD-like signal output (HDOD) protein
MTYELSVSISKEVLAPLLAMAQTSAAEAALVHTLEGGRAALPLLPHVAARALELANRPESTAREFGELIMTDPPIAARFLATANSALYSRGHTIRSVPEAVARIGLSGSRDLVFQVVYAGAVTGMKLYQAEVQESFRKSVLAGMVCRVAAPILQLEIGEAYLCGLLHDIGESRVYRILSEGAVTPVAGEAAQLVQKYHPRAGAELAMRWALPEDIIQVCRLHEEKGPPTSEHLRLVRVADVLVRQLDPEASLELSSSDLEELQVPFEIARTILERSRALAQRI